MPLAHGIEGNIQSAKLPGGDLVSAVLYRPLMGLADRGAASAMIGQRWADHCAGLVDTWSGRTFPVPHGDDRQFTLQQVVRLDHDQKLVHRAARAGLQNPDLLFLGTVNSQPAIQAVDAKFSVETARSKQVSAETLSNLLELVGETEQFGAIEHHQREVVAGLFLSPDYPITELMLNGRTGIRRTTVARSEVVQAPVDAGDFFQPLENKALMAALAAVDSLTSEPETSLMAGLYYFRLGRACVACWVDATTPALADERRGEVDLQVVAEEIRARTVASPSAIALVVKWDQDVEETRRQRLALEKAASLPVAARELRDWIESETKAAGTVAPPVNQVRKRLAIWHRQRMKDQVGPMQPPLQNVRTILDQWYGVSNSMRPEIELKAREIARLLQQEPVSDTADD